MSAATKECPFCAETIKAAAALCRFCGRDLPQPASPAASNRGVTRAPLEEPSGATLLQQPEVFDLLAAMVEKSLILYEVDEQGRGRYRLLETVRQYSRDRLVEAGDGEATRDRHLAFYLRLGEQAEKRLRSAEQRNRLEQPGYPGSPPGRIRSGPHPGEARHATDPGSRPARLAGGMPGVLAGAEAGQQQGEQAARLLGAAAALREATGYPVERVDRRFHDRSVSATREQLTAEAFAAAWAQGHALPLEQALAGILGEEADG